MLRWSGTVLLTVLTLFLLGVCSLPDYLGTIFWVALLLGGLVAMALVHRRKATWSLSRFMADCPEKPVAKPNSCTGKIRDDITPDRQPEKNPARNSKENRNTG